MKLIKFIFILCILITSGYSNNAKYERYYNELKRLKDSEISSLILSYSKGHKDGVSLILTSIVWKESMFGRYLINKDDGVYGSFGLAQILLSTSAIRHKVSTDKERSDLQLKLITDPIFNLEEALKELMYWKKQYKDSNYWTTHMIASYNNGWKGYNGKGKDYADDTKLRRKVLVDFFRNKDNLNHPVFSKYLMIIRSDMVKQGLIKD